MEFWTAFTIGFFGSFHCVGMCGPIALAIPIKGLGFSGKLISTFLYNLGRIITYSFFGALFGLMGKGIQMAGLQQWLSISIGVVILLYFGLPIVLKKKSIANNSVSVNLIGKLKNIFSAILNSKTYGSLLVLGILNGFLPCGLVYLAIAGAIVSDSPINGSIYMALFGLGTFPFMLLLPLIGDFLTISLRNKMKKMVPVFVLFFGVLFVLRGLNLGIPYISPQFNEQNTGVKKCCHTPSSFEEK